MNHSQRNAFLHRAALAAYIREPVGQWPQSRPPARAPEPAWVLYRCKACNHVQAMSAMGGPMAECCDAPTKDFHWVQVVQQGPWREMHQLLGGTAKNQEAT